MTEEKFYQYDDKKRQLARLYEKSKLVLDSIVGTIIPIAACLSLLISGASPRISRTLTSAFGSYWLTVATYAIVFIIYLQLVEIPLRFYTGYIVDHDYGISTQRLRGWVGDELKEFGIAVGLGVLGVTTLYYLIRLTDLWWLAASTLFALFSILLSIVLPYVIMPIFYKVTPLEDADLKVDLLGMSKKVGAKSVHNVLVADESRRSVRANAMFSGIGSSKAIVLFDTLLNNFTKRELKTVVAHELGHYVNKDIWKSALISGVMSIPPFFIADYVFKWAGKNLNIFSISDPSGLPLIFTILVAVGFFLQPISNGFSRAIERKADEFALRVADDADAQASAERRLADMSLSVDTPQRLVEWFFYSHPCASRRVRLAEEWKTRSSQLVIESQNEKSSMDA
jgi:STE24 endopeptidase